MTEQHQVGPTWQSIWINLIHKANEQYLIGELKSSWNTIIILNSWLPEETQNECKEKFVEITNKLEENRKNTKGHDRITIEHQFNNKNKAILIRKIPEILSKIRSSLETHNWITRPSGYSGIDANKELDDL